LSGEPPAARIELCEKDFADAIGLLVDLNTLPRSGFEPQKGRHYCATYRDGFGPLDGGTWWQTDLLYFEADFGSKTRGLSDTVSAR
jgi:hypothetical protein